MTIAEKIDFKKRLAAKAIEIIDQRIYTASNAMQSAQDAANEEEKSSAGDKYETARAMSHLEKDMYARQVLENKNELALLRTVVVDRLYEKIVAGSFISCTGFNFFIAAGLGKIDFEGGDVYLLSANAPLAKILYNKKQGDMIRFQGKELVISSVF